MGRVRTTVKEQAILEAASRVFAGRPFHEVLIDDIAGSAGIGKGTIYRYFETKDELYFATILYGIDSLGAAIEKALPPEASAPERLECVATEILSYFWDRRHIYPLLQHDAQHPERRDELMNRREPILRLVQQTILSGIERRELTGTDARIGAELFLGMVRAANLFRRPEDTLEELVAEVMRVFLSGVERRET